MIDASVKKSNLFFSVAPGLSVLMATDMRLYCCCCCCCWSWSCVCPLRGIRSVPLQTSPNSPPPMTVSMVTVEVVRMMTRSAGEKRHRRRIRALRRRHHGGSGTDVAADTAAHRHAAVAVENERRVRIGRLQVVMKLHLLLHLLLLLMQRRSRMRHFH